VIGRKRQLHFQSPEILIMVLEKHVNVDITYFEIYGNVKTQGHIIVQNLR